MDIRLRDLRFDPCNCDEKIDKTFKDCPCKLNNRICVSACSHYSGAQFTFTDSLIIILSLEDLSMFKVTSLITFYEQLYDNKSGGKKLETIKNELINHIGFYQGLLMIRADDFNSSGGFIFDKHKYTCWLVDHINNDVTEDQLIKLYSRIPINKVKGGRFHCNCSGSCNYNCICRLTKNLCTDECIHNDNKVVCVHQFRLLEYDRLITFSKDQLTSLIKFSSTKVPTNKNKDGISKVLDKQFIYRDNKLYLVIAIISDIINILLNNNNIIALLQERFPQLNFSKFDEYLTGAISIDGMKDREEALTKSNIIIMIKTNHIISPYAPLCTVVKTTEGYKIDKLFYINKLQTKIKSVTNGYSNKTPPNSTIIPKELTKSPDNPTTPNGYSNNLCQDSSKVELPKPEIPPERLNLSMSPSDMKLLTDQIIAGIKDLNISTSNVTSPQSQPISPYSSLINFKDSMQITAEDSPTPERVNPVRLNDTERRSLWKQWCGSNMDQGRCFCCQELMEYDNFEAGHIKPKSKGGSNEITNLRPICRKCNGKGGMGCSHMYEYMFYRNMPGCNNITMDQPEAVEYLNFTRIIKVVETKLEHSLATNRTDQQFITDFERYIHNPNYTLSHRYKTLEKLCQALGINLWDVIFGKH